MTDRNISPTGTIDGSAASWVPTTCTLPTVERPLRGAEFDALFANSLHRVQRIAPTALLLTFDAGAGSTARDLTAREAECCSFFTFTVTPAGDELHVAVEVPATHGAVLDALTERAAAARTAVA